MVHRKTRLPHSSAAPVTSPKRQRVAPPPNGPQAHASIHDDSPPILKATPFTVDNLPMPPHLDTRLKDRLLATAAPGGGWGYRPSGSAYAEPTALTLLALADEEQGNNVRSAAMDWLARIQRVDGSVPVSSEIPSPGWATALSVLAWHTESRRGSNAYQTNMDRALRWTLAQQGQPLPRNPTVFGHDTTLLGWPWVDGTHTWAEPTAYALLALRSLGLADHPRAREGVRVLLDRALPSGGWNYGNTRVFQNVLRPFPATTGVVLASLAGEPREPRIESAIAYLKKALPRVRAPMSLAWGLIGLSAWNERPTESALWLDEAAEHALKREADPMGDALLLIADHGAVFPTAVKTARSERPASRGL